MKLWALFLAFTSALIAAFVLLLPHGGETAVTDVVHHSVTVRQLPAASSAPPPALLPPGSRTRTIQIGA
jgi:hypothetical protein